MKARNHITRRKAVNLVRRLVPWLKRNWHSVATAILRVIAVEVIRHFISRLGW